MKKYSIVIAPGGRSLSVASETLIDFRKRIWKSELSHLFYPKSVITSYHTKILVAMRLGETPVLIPNTKVKT